MIVEKPRLDGFEGQHLVVVPQPVCDAAARHPLLRSLLVTDAGYFPRAKGHRVDRAAGAPTHLLIACLKGRGWFRDGATIRHVQAGDVVWLNANQSHAYGAELDDPWTIGWVHFCGTEAEQWRKYIGFPDDAPTLLNHVTEEGITALRLEQIHLSLEKGYSIPDLISAALLLRNALDQIARAVRTGGGTRSAAERIAMISDYLREDLSHPHRLDELATAAGLSVPHFCALFRRYMGYAPIDFLIRQRMQRACQLLDTTDRSISAIGAEVGYEDAYYFSRSFRRITGCSPRAYRNITKG